MNTDAVDAAVCTLAEQISNGQTMPDVELGNLTFRFACPADAIVSLGPAEDLRGEEG